MSRLRRYEPDISDSLNSLFRQAVAPWRFDDRMLSSFNRPLFLAPTINDSFESMFRRMFGAWDVRDDLLNGMNVNVDVVEKDGIYKVSADLPGVKKEDINVRIDGNVVRIDAQTHDAKEVKEDGKVLRNERYYGAVSRTFTLAQDVDESKAVGKYSDGVLTLELPKKASSTADVKRIAIQ